ncbi:MAG TPA: Ig-like domain-containing protein, partial [Treponemataceae bacterium]|nr:Ig-like domain-containing protein [Treponemataceae bacterium]
LTDGNYNYVIIAINSASETLAINRNFQIDTTAPSLIISTPATDQTINYIPFAFNGSVTDTTSGVQKVEYSFDKNIWNTAAISGSEWSFIYNKVTSGNFALYVRATDNAGNIISETKNFTLYLPAFTLTETEIGSDTMQTRNTNSFTLGGTVTSPDGDMSVTATRNGDSIQLSFETVNATTVNWSYSESGLPDNIYNYVITATNSASETLSIGRYIRIDTIAPDITITDPSSGQKIYNASHVFHGSVTDGASGVKNVEYSFDNTTWNAASILGSSWSFTRGNLSDGNLTLYLRSTDNAGNIATLNETFIVEVTIFSLTETTVNSENVQLKNGGPIILTGAVTSPDGNVTLTATKNGTPITLTNTTNETGLTWTLNDYDIQDGSYTYVFTATNSTSDVLTLSRNFEIDGTAPIIIYYSPQPNQVIEYLPYEFSGTISDTGTGIKTFSYSLDGENWYPFEPTEESWIISFNNTAEQNFTLYLQAFDNVNNQAYFEIPFSTSFPEPILEETQLGQQNPSYKNAYPYNIGGTIVTPFGGHVTFTVTKDSVPLTGVVPTTTDSMTWNWNYEETTGIQGTFNYEITATSDAGKTTALNRQVCVDWEPPQIIVQMPLPLSSTSLMEFTGFSGEVIENGSGITTVLYQIDGGVLTPLPQQTPWFIQNPGLQAGEHTINFQASDRSGNMTNGPMVSFTLTQQ